MNQPILLTASYVMTVIMIVGMIFFVFRRGSPVYNRACAMQWFKSMDVAKNNQRYLGGRAIVLADIDSRKKGSVGFEILLACRTPSNRAFYISVTSIFGEVVDWKLIPVAYDEMIEALRADNIPFNEEDNNESKEVGVEKD